MKWTQTSTSCNRRELCWHLTLQTSSFIVTITATSESPAEPKQVIVHRLVTTQHVEITTLLRLCRFTEARLSVLNCVKLYLWTYSCFQHSMLMAYFSHCQQIRWKDRRLRATAGAEGSESTDQLFDALFSWGLLALMQTNTSFIFKIRSVFL